MLVHGKQPSEEIDRTRGSDFPTIEFEPAALFNVQLPPGTASASPDNFAGAAEILRTALASDTGLEHLIYKSQLQSADHLNLELVKVKLDRASNKSLAQHDQGSNIRTIPFACCMDGKSLECFLSLNMLKDLQLQEQLQEAKEGFMAKVNLNFPAILGRSGP